MATAQQGVHPTWGTRRVFRDFSWLEVSSVKVAWSRPTHQPSSGRYATGNTSRWVAVLACSVKYWDQTELFRPHIP
jgi:hypothetical protein